MLVLSHNFAAKASVAPGKHSQAFQSSTHGGFSSQEQTHRYCLPQPKALHGTSFHPFKMSYLFISKAE